jgi:hypothetical protein
MIECPLMALSPLSEVRAERADTTLGVLKWTARALRAILAQVRACSGVPADKPFRAVPANMTGLLPSAL